MERRLNRNPQLKEQYLAVINEYLELKHMSEVSNANEPGFYLPHHAVMKESSLTTKIRVVFDGSAQSSSGISLHETLLTGPTIQDRESRLDCRREWIVRIKYGKRNQNTHIAHTKLKI